MSDAQATPTPTPPAAPTAAASQPPTSADPRERAVREAVEKLREALPKLQAEDKSLAERVETVIQQADNPAHVNRLSFQHQVAYAAEDAGKSLGRDAFRLSATTAVEIKTLAGSAPQLENTRAQSLLSETTGIMDPSLVRDIRRAGTEIGLQENQDTPAIRDRLDTLENRLRLAPRIPLAPETSSPPQPPRGQSGPEEGTETVRAANGQRRGADQPPQQSQSQTGFVPGGGGNALQNAMFRAMRGGGSNTPPWEAGAQPFGERLSAFEGRMMEGRDHIALRDAERSGRAALEAMQGFREGEGAIIMNRINAAARSEPNGMAGVLSEMKDGGKYADLRQQFNAALADERGVAAAYDRAAVALASYGKDRTAVEQVIARRPDAANLSAKFESMDKEIAQAGGEMPSRRDGKTMIEDLSRQVAEMLQRAVDNVKNLFSRGASAGASPSGPSPS